MTRVAAACAVTSVNGDAIGQPLEVDWNEAIGEARSHGRSEWWVPRRVQ